MKKDKWFISFLELAIVPFWCVWNLGQKVSAQVYLFIAVCLIIVSLAGMVL